MLSLLFLIPIVLYPIFRAIYNVTYHPLAKYPGPVLYRAFVFPYVYHVFKGDLPRMKRKFHDRYGSVVRISPNGLSFTSAQAWRDIYAARAPQLPKDPEIYAPPDELTTRQMAMEKDDAKHKAARDQLRHAFSSKVLLEYQPLIAGYVDQLITLIRTKSHGNKSLDITAYFNWITFDIIGHLTFGESFHCLDTTSYHPWITVIFDGLAFGCRLNQLNRYGLLDLVLKFIPESMHKSRADMIAYSREQVDARLKLGFGPDTRKDFAYFMRHGPEHREHQKDSKTEGMSRDTMVANSETLIAAGSETTATLLSGLTYLLLTKRPDYLERIKQEVRTAFTNDTLEEMNFKSVTDKLPLMIAAIREALRDYPPAPFGFARKVVDAPRVIDGNVVPVGTSVSVSQYAANHAAHNWYQPDEFLPERWFADATWPGSPYEHDQRESSQPFSMGPRNCIGKTLAEVESRLIYARMLFNFDFELVDGQDDWISRQKQDLILEKSPLMVRFRDARAQ